VIGPEADAFPFLRAAACGKVDIVSAGTYGSLVHSCGQDVSFYGMGWVGEIVCDGGRLNLYGVAGLGRLIANNGETRLFGGRAVDNLAHVGLRGSARVTLAGSVGLDVHVRTPREVTIQALARSAVHRYAKGQIHSCDSPVGWAGSGAIELDATNHKHGAACLTATSADVHWFSRVMDPIDTDVAEKNGALRLWLYISDVGQLKGENSIELTSSGSYDRDEYSWSLGALNLQNGWNDLTLRFDKAGKIGQPDLRRINYFRVYGFLSGPITRKIDHIRVEQVTPVQ
jgi:hypothetical protein